MAELPAYAGFGPYQTPHEVETVFRRISRVFSGNRILRTCRGLGGGQAFLDGTRIAGGVCEIYGPEHASEWAMSKASALDPMFAKMPGDYQKWAAACVCAVLGVDGNSPVQELIVWLDPKRSGPQYWSVLAAHKAGIPVHNMADPGVLASWGPWAEQHAPKYAPVPA